MATEAQQPNINVKHRRPYNDVPQWKQSRQANMKTAICLRHLTHPGIQDYNITDSPADSSQPMQTRLFCVLNKTSMGKKGVSIKAPSGFAQSIAEGTGCIEHLAVKRSNIASRCAQSRDQAHARALSERGKILVALISTREGAERAMVTEKNSTYIEFSLAVRQNSVQSYVITI